MTKMRYAPYMTPLVETLVIIAANVIGAAMAFPQAWRVLRHRQIAGVSPTWAAVSVTTNAWWVVYALAIGNPAIIPVAGISVIGYAAIVVGLARQGALGDGFGLALGSSVAVALVPLAALQLGGWPIAGLSLGLLYAVQLSPAVITAIRASDLLGVATGTWIVAAVESVLWGVYGAARGDLGLISLAVVGIIMSTIVLTRVARFRALRLATS